MDGPLSDLRILELGGDVAVRYCGRLFALLGAAVTRLDSAAGDDRIGRGGASGEAFGRWLDEGKQAGDGAAFNLVICGQDLAAVAAAERLVKGFEGAPVLLRLTWFGLDGPYADWTGNDAILQALSGVAYTFGEEAGPPVLAQGHAPQIVAGLTAFIAALAALMGEARPARIDVNVLEAALCFAETGAVAKARVKRLGVNRYSPTYPCSIYPTTDGCVGVTALTLAQWISLCGLIGRKDLAEDRRFQTTHGRLRHADEIDALLTPHFAERSTMRWVNDGIAQRIPMTPVPRPGELPAHEHWGSRGAFASVPGGSAEAPIAPFRFAWKGASAARPPGGEHGPLTGVRVADFSMGWAGPLAARYFADLGADVLKIESAHRMDWWRGWEEIEGQDLPSAEIQRNFLAVNRNKRGLDLDLSSGQGLDRARGLIARCDIVIENLGPGVMDRLGLGPADQRRLNPAIISIFMPPFGKNGPLAGVRAYGSTVEQGSGMPFVNGHSHWAPCLQHVAYGDPVAGLYAAAAALAALRARPRMGGADIELCQVECLFQLAADAIIGEQIAGATPRNGSRRPTAAPCCVVESAEPEAWLAIAVDSEAGWKGLCGVTGIDPATDRHTEEDLVEAALADWARTHTPVIGAALLQAKGVAAAPVLPAHALSLDPHLEHHGYFLTQHRRYVENHLQPASPFRFDGDRPALRRPAPTLGEHTAEVIAEVLGE